MLNSKQPPRVNTVRAGQTQQVTAARARLWIKKNKADSSGWEWVLPRRQTAKRTFTRGNKLAIHGWKWREVGVFPLTWPGMDGGGGQKYGLLNRGSAILKIDICFRHLKKCSRVTCWAINAPSHSVLSSLQIFQIRCQNIKAQTNNQLAG